MDPGERKGEAPLEVDRLSVSLPAWGDRAEAVSDVSFTIAPNEILCLVGESGSGKSVIARSILGLLPPGQLTPSAKGIRFFGENMLTANERRMRAIRGRHIGMIFQDPMTALNPLMTIGGQIDELLRLHCKLSSQQRRSRILDMLDQVHLPDPPRIYRTYPHEVSGGQRQRAMIAQALILKPQVLIADEPTTALDVTTQAQILRLIRDLQIAHGASVLFITHDFGVVAQIADKIGVMRQGRLLELGSAEQVLTRPRQKYTRDLLAAVPTVMPRQPDPAIRHAPLHVEVESLRKTYGSSGIFGGAKRPPALDGVSIALRKGSTLGVVGESGSGKSTLARCIARLIDVDDGQIRLNGTEIAGLSRRAMRPLRAKMQVVFQDPYSSLNPRRKVGELIAQGPILAGTRREIALREARNLLTMVGLQPSAADRYPHEFSGGQRQRIGIARAIAMRPDLLIADEPVSALDVTVQRQILDLLEQIRRDFHLTMLFITHDLRVASQICDDLIVMQRGRIVEHGTTAEIFASPKHPYTRELLSALPGRTDWSDRARHSLLEGQTA